MLIYLDLNVIQELKKDDGGQLLELIQADQKRNIYCFSEAHLHDLSRDRTDEKFADMALIEKVAGENCFSFDKKVIFQHETPREYYDRFDWSPVESLENLFSDSHILLDKFKLILLDFNSFLTDAEWPLDMPANFRNILKNTVTFYDFFIAFCDFSQELTDQQKSFKGLLQYLRNQNLIGNIFDHLGIRGFDGTNIINPKVFMESYSAFCLKEMPNANIYVAFVRLYYCLEFLGIVKGKAAKQKMLNLANDGRHAFFGGYCNMVVSKDVDFINKANFLYGAYGIHPYIIPFEEFRNWLVSGPRPDDSIDGMVKEVLNIANLYFIEERETTDTIYTSYSLSKLYYDYFDVLTIGNCSGSYFFYFSAEKLLFTKGTLLQQINLLTELLLKDLGIDMQLKGSFTSTEISNDEWPGRGWFYGDYQVELHLNDGLHLTFNALPVPK
jgi:hypothetical protein